MPVTQQITTQSGADGSSSNRSANSTRTERTSQKSATSQGASTDTSESSSTQEQLDDYAVEIAFSITINQALPCDEL